MTSFGINLYFISGFRISGFTTDTSLTVVPSQETVK